MHQRQNGVIKQTELPHNGLNPSPFIANTPYANQKELRGAVNLIHAYFFNFAYQYDPRFFVITAMITWHHEGTTGRLSS